MSERPAFLDPEVEGLLRELAAGSTSSSLLAVEPPAALVDPLLDAPSRSAGTIGWKPIERHLLQAHREELALVLQQAFAVEMYRNDSSRVLAAVERPDWARGDETSVRRRVRALASRRPLTDLSMPITDVVAGLVSGDPDLRPPLSQLAGAARLLADSESARLLIALAEDMEGRPGRALGIALPVARQSLRQDMRSAAWTAVGLAQCLLRNPGGAVEAYRTALENDPSCFSSAASFLLSSIRAEDGAAARDAAGALDAIAPPAERVEAHVLLFRRRAGMGPERFRKEHPIIRSLTGSVGPSSQALLDGIFQD